MKHFKLFLLLAVACASAFGAAQNPIITSSDVPNGLSSSPSANGVTLRGFREVAPAIWQQVAVQKHGGSSFAIPGGVIGVSGYNGFDQNWGEGSRTLDNIGSNEKLRADVVYKTISATINASIFATGPAYVVVTMFDGNTPVDSLTLPAVTGNNQNLVISSASAFNRIEIGFPAGVARNTVSGAVLVGVNSISLARLMITSADVSIGLSSSPSANGVTLRGFREVAPLTWQQVSVQKHGGSSFTIPGDVIGVAGYNSSDQSWGEGSRTLDNIGSNEKLRADAAGKFTEVTINASIFATGPAYVVVTMFDGNTPVDSLTLPAVTGNNQNLVISSASAFNRIEIGFPSGVNGWFVPGATLVGVNSISFNY